MSVQKIVPTAIVVPLAGLLGMAAWLSGSTQQPDHASPAKQAAAAEPSSIADDKPLPREKYQFDGKSFAEWKAYALAELKVQRRIEAIGTDSEAALQKLNEAVKK